MGSAFATAAVVAPDNKTFANGTAWLRTDKVPVLFNRWLGLGVSMIFVLPTFVALFNLYRSMNKEEQQEGSRETLDEHASKNVEASTMTDATCTADNCSSTVMGPKQNKQENACKLLPSALAACLFAVGLAVSGMVLPSKVLGFLNLYTIPLGTYDPTLLTVMIGGCIISMISYQFVKPFSLIFRADSKSPLALDRPLLVSKFSVPCNRVIDFQLIFGAMCFGIGWALAGVCPGPAIFLFATGAKPVIICWWPAFFVGSVLAQWIKSRPQTPSSAVDPAIAATATEGVQEITPEHSETSV
jgi:hypothetical protein